MEVSEKQCKGNCVKCNSESIDYKAMTPEDEYVFYPYECLDCGYEGKEYYTLVYDASE